MERKQLKQYQSILQDLRRDALNDLRRREDIHIEREADALDELQNATHRDLVVADLNRSNQKLRLIEAALQRVDEGAYGECEGCEEPIPAKRLMALPWAVRCVACQEHFDAQRAAGMAEEEEFYAPQAA